MDDRSEYDQERREALPEHEYRQQTEVGGVDPSGTAEESGEILDAGDARASTNDEFDPDEVPPVSRSG